MKPWVEKFARFGIMTRGFVYILVGLLSLMAAMGVGGKTTDTKGALAAVVSIPFGEIIIWLLAVGLVGYVIWRAIQVIVDPEKYGHDFKGISTRMGFALSAVIHGSLAITAIKLASHAGSSEDPKYMVTAKVLSYPAGQWLIGLIGLGVIGFGLYQIFDGYSERFIRNLKTNEMDPREKILMNNVGKIGIISRGIVFCVIGYFLIQTALYSNPDKEVGMDGALQKIAEQTWGQWLLAFVALGLLFYGIYQIMEGKNRHLNINT